MRRRLAVVAPLAAITALAAPARGQGAVAPPPVFVERTDTGVDFVHRRFQTAGKKYLPEVTGAGLALFDYDSDGDLDLYCVQSCPLPGFTGTEGPLPDQLYRNDGNWRFARVPPEWEVPGRDGQAPQRKRLGLGDLDYGMGATAPDVNNDGHPDLFVTNVGRDVLYRNNGDGTFTDVTEASGIQDDYWSAAAGWADLDQDGDLDLYLANYAAIDFARYRACGTKERVSYCHPDGLKSAPDRLYRNDGGFRFTEITQAAGIVEAGSGAKGLAVVPFDYDDDGRIDLYVANDADPNYLWVNRGGMKFEEEAGYAGVAVSGRGHSQSCMGSDIADVDGDLDFDILSVNFGKEASILYIRGDDGLYEDRTYPSGLGAPSYLFTGFGAQFLDHDRDADLDLIVVNGHILDTAHEMDPQQTFEQVPHFFVNRGNGTFLEVGPTLSPFFTRPNLGRGLAAGDLDNDGDLDVVVQENDHPLVLLENRDPNTHHWIAFDLVGTRSPRTPIGARLLLTCGDKQQVAEVRGSVSFISWVDTRLFFGVGNRTAKCAARIRWPSGRVQELADLELDRYHKVVEPTE